MRFPAYCWLVSVFFVACYSQLNFESWSLPEFSSESNQFNQYAGTNLPKKLPMFKNCGIPMGYPYHNLESRFTGLCLSFLQLHPFGICHGRLSLKGCQHKPPRSSIRENRRPNRHPYSCTIKDFWCAVVQSYHIAQLQLTSILSILYQNYRSLIDRERERRGGTW